MNKKLLINARILTMNARMETYPCGNILIEGGRIREVSGERLEVADAEVTDVQGMVVLPGFINVHTHLPMTLLGGMQTTSRCTNGSRNTFSGRGADGDGGECAGGGAVGAGGDD